MPFLNKEYDFDGSSVKTNLVQLDIPGRVVAGSDFMVTVRMETSDQSSGFPWGAYTQCVVFQKSLEDGLDRGSVYNDMYHSWFADGTASHNGYTKLVKEDGSRSYFQHGRLIQTASSTLGGDYYNVNFSLKMMGVIFLVEH